MERRATGAETVGAMAQALEAALRQDAIRPAFQPIVQLKDASIASFEVLARWEDEALGSVPPDRFIPVAESSGLITSLTMRIIEAACAAAGDWEGEFRLAFNIPPRHLEDSRLPRLFEEAVRRGGFPLERTAVEITETGEIRDLEAARETIGAMRAGGVRIAIDDFGTGHSGLSRLQSIPFDEIKVDRRFVRCLEESPDSRSILGAMIGLGQRLGSPVVAEGVETPGQAEALRSLGCDLAQGWLFGHPVPASQVPALLRAREEAVAGWEPRSGAPVHRLAGIEAAYAAAPIGLLFLDRGLWVRSANRHGAALLGQEHELLEGRPVQALGPGLARAARDALAHAERGAPIPPSRLPAGRSQGLLGFQASAVRDAAGELLGLSIVLTQG